MEASPVSKNITIFFSFAFTSPDKQLFKRLQIHLKGLMHRDLIYRCYDSEASPGDNVRQIIPNFIRMADIIVLLISADFFGSDQCAHIEMKYALEQSRRRDIPLIPVLLRPTDWHGFALEDHRPLPLSGKAVTQWKNRDLAFTEIAKGIRQVIEGLTQRVTGGTPKVQPPEFPLYLVPERQYPFFTDRKELLTAIHDAFTRGQTQTQALHGLGGMGKTLLAAKYAQRYQDEYDAVFWLNASTREQLSTDILSLAAPLGLPVYNDSHEQELFRALKQWLRQHPRWLVILDNLDDFPLLTHLIPSQDPTQHVLFITHTGATGAYGDAVSVAPMPEEESVLFLLRRAKLIPRAAARHEVSEDLYALALTFVQEVQGYPLALDQAGAYIEETGRDLASYLQLYHDQQADLLERRGQVFYDHPDSVTATLTLTFDKVAESSPLALELLRLFALLHADALPNELFSNGAATLPEPLRTHVARPVLFDTLLATLQRFSLIQHRADLTMVTMQRVVQVVIREQLTQDQLRSYAIHLVRLVDASFPEPLFTNWSDCERYLSHAQRCAELIHEFQLTFLEAAQLLHRLGNYCDKHAFYSQAERYFQEALRIREQLQGPEHLDTAQALNALAVLYVNLGTYQQAEPFYQRALTIREGQLGAAHPLVAQSLSNLGHLAYERGDYTSAEHLLRRAVHTYEDVLKIEDLRIVYTLSHLALVHEKLGRYEQAEALYLRALSIRERELWPEHPEVASSLNSLGLLWYHYQGKLQEAQPLLLRALSIRKTALGETHPKTALSMDTLAGLYQELEDEQQAEALFRQALAIYEQVFGPDHEETARVLNNLAFLFKKQGRYQQAESLYKRTLAIYEQHLGPEHVRTANILHNLGRLVEIQGDKKRAEFLFRRALAIRERELGFEHINTGRTLNGLAEVLTSQGFYDQAEPLFLRALSIHQRVLGSEHADVAFLLEKYVVLLQRTNRQEEAITIQQTISAIQRREQEI